MNKIMKAPRAYIILIAAGVLFFSGTAVRGASNTIDAKISETKDAVQKLLELKDDTTISAKDREKLEFQLKKSIVADIIDISGTQLNDAREQMQKTAFPQSEDWNEVKKFISVSLDEYDTYYKDARQSLRANDLTLDAVKDIAKKIEEKKTSEIDVFLRKTANIGTTFGISDILKRADERLKKVESDVDKVYAQKLTQKGDLKNSFQKAAEAVGNARTLNNRTKEIILNIYTATTSSSTQTSTSSDFMISFEKDVQTFLNEKSTSTPSEELATSTPPLTNEQKEEYLQDLIRQSAEKVRDAYTIFIQMSLDGKEYIKE